MKHILTLAALLCAALYGQDGVAVNQVDAPPPRAYQTIYTYTGSNLTSICWALSTQPVSSAISISAASNAAAASLSSTAHGLHASSLPQVTISGGTGNWAAINGTWTATITGADTFTIPVNSTAFGALAGTITFTTRAPRTSNAVWAVMVFVYDGSNYLIWKGAVGGNYNLSNACATPTQYQ